jgi:UDP-N-acetylmuramoyl-tripeptide--D-alanyl-D-alanine ligase
MAFLRKQLQKILFILARAVLNKYQPKVIGITGSIGKTSTKEAIFTVLKDKFEVRTNIKNYNNEIGLPLTILGEESAGKNVFGWLKIFGKGLDLIIFERNYPKILVLEMGIDRIGDMKYLTDMVPVDIGVVTKIAAVHLEFFKTIDKIAKEKSILVQRLKTGGWGVLNVDDEKVAEMKNVVNGRFVTFGLDREAQVRALEIDLSYKADKVAGLSFKLVYNGAVVPVFLPNILAEHLIYSVLAAASVGVIMEMNLLEISQALFKFVSPLGRMRLIEGIAGSQIIDDTYNASPESTVAAIKTLVKIKNKRRKIAVLGDMLELGDYEREGHELVGKEIVQSPIDLLIVVGNRAKVIANYALDAGFKGEVKFFTDSVSAGNHLKGEIVTGDLILIKGSQGVRMEKVSLALLAQTEQARKFLVRQDESWLNR